MKSKLLIAVIAAAFLPIAAFANDCSGGADGGMDATGNQCNTPAAVTTNASEGATTASAQPARVEKKKAVARKSTAMTRNASTRARVKHG